MKVIVDTHVVIRIDDVPPVAVRELKQMFTHRNPKHFNATRMGFWTGNIEEEIKTYEADGSHLLLPRGALRRIVQTLEEHGLDVEVRDKTLRPPNLNLKLQPGVRGRPYQVLAMRSLADGGSGTLRGPCGSGKTIILILTVAELNLPTIVVVHTRELLHQWAQRISEWLGVAPGIVGDRRFQPDKPIVVAMEQTLYSRFKTRPHPWQWNFGLVVGDECHHWAAKTFRAVGSMFPAAHRIGASADERRKDGLESLVGEVFGPVLHVIEKSDLVSLGNLVPTRLTLVPTTFRDGVYVDSKLAGESPDWNGMVGRMNRDSRRTALARLTAIRAASECEDARVLILNDRVQYCVEMAEWLHRDGHSVGLLIGGQKNKREANRTIAGLRSGKVTFGVGTKVADEGLDIPALTHVVVTSPVHGHLKRLGQMIGRAARVHGCKREARAFYLWDVEMFPWVEGKTEREIEAARRKFIRRFVSVVDEVEVLGKTPIL